MKVSCGGPTKRWLPIVSEITAGMQWMLLFEMKQQVERIEKFRMWGKRGKDQGHQSLYSILISVTRDRQWQCKLFKINPASLYSSF